MVTKNGIMFSNGLIIRYNFQTGTLLGACISSFRNVTLLLQLPRLKDPLTFFRPRRISHACAKSNNTGWGKSLVLEHSHYTMNQTETGMNPSLAWKRLFKLFVDKRRKKQPKIPTIVLRPYDYILGNYTASTYFTGQWLFLWIVEISDDCKLSVLSI